MVKVIITDAGQAAAHAEEFINDIAEYYAAAYRRIRKKQEADQELASGFLLKKYLGIGSDTQLIRGKHGKPMLRAGEGSKLRSGEGSILRSGEGAILPSGAEFFSISHSGEYAALALAPMDIGMDMERVMAVHWPTVRKVFTVGQKKGLESQPEPRQPLEFTRMWTEQEAVLKLLGTGFAVEAGEPESAGAGRLGTGVPCCPGAAGTCRPGPAGLCRSGSAGPCYPGALGPIIHSIRYKDYIITCAAHEEFDMSVEENMWI